MYNPQFPHKFRVVRAGLDEHGDPILNENGDPTEVTVTLTAVVMVDRQPTFDADGNFVTEEVSEMAFGYRQNSMNTMREGDVIVSDYKISCPIFLTPLNPGDVLELTDYEKTFRGVVVKKDTFNLGSLIWFDRIKNENILEPGKDDGIDPDPTPEPTPAPDPDPVPDPVPETDPDEDDGIDP